MKRFHRFCWYALLSFACSCEVSAQELTVKGGDAKVVKIDKVVIVQEDRTVLTSFPFSVHAPEGAALYFWSVPNGVVWADKGSSIDIGSAPKGDLLIGVKTLIVDFKAEKVVTKFHSVTLAIGEPGPGPKPPPPVPPDVEPDDVIWPALKAAWATEPVDSRAADRDAYANIFRDAGGWVNDLKFSLVVDVNREMTKRRDAVIDGRLAATRKVINAELSKVLPTAVDAKISADVGRSMVYQFQRVEKLLRALK